MKVLKRTKKDENRIIVWNIFFGFFTVIVVIIFFFYVVPGVSEVSSKKQELAQLKEKYDNYKKNWVPISEIKNSLSGLDLEWVDKLKLNSIFKEITDDFYNKNLKNTKEADFRAFINKKIKTYKDDAWNDEKLKITSKVLPLYDKDFWGKERLTDFEFINYIESIISTFNLKYNNPIWIKDVVYLEDYKITNNDNSFDKWISKIPVEFDITWRKADVLNFLYFIENVWKVDVNFESGEIIINTPKENKNFDFKNMKLDSVKADENYNIFNNQIMDVEFIEMQDDIDSSDNELVITESWNEFINYIKNNQEKESFKIKLKLNFYVKWLPKYKVDEFNKKFDTKLSDLDKEVTKMLWDWTINQTDKQKLKNIKTSIDAIKNATKQSWEENENTLIQNFQNNTSYMNILESIEENIKKINNKK